MKGIGSPSRDRRDLRLISFYDSTLSHIAYRAFYLVFLPQFFFLIHNLLFGVTICLSTWISSFLVCSFTILHILTWFSLVITFSMNFDWFPLIPFFLSCSPNSNSSPPECKGYDLGGLVIDDVWFESATSLSSFSTVDSPNVENLFIESF